MCKCSANIKAIPWAAGQIGAPQKLIDSSTNGYTFAYAPSIIKVGNVWHAYFCSSGTGATAWDYIRHSTSNDLATWSTPDTLLIPSDPINERSCCDPSIVKFNAGDGDFYYLFYSGNKLNVQTVNFVARSASPFGPFAKRTERGTWEVGAPDPKVIQQPFNAAPESSNVYGRGQPAVVAKGSLLYMWFTDNTAKAPSNFDGMVYMSTSTNGVDWARPVSTGVSSWSIDVKYDEANDAFIMFSGEDHHGALPKMVSRVSDEGVHWSDPTVLFDMPPYSHNVGVSGGERGELQPSKMLYAYGAPADLANNPSWANWDLYGQIHGAVVSADTSTVVYKKIDTASATEAINGLPASHAADGDANTFYSSQYFANKVIDRYVHLVGYFGSGKTTISKVVLKARMWGSIVMCFPEKYTLYVTSPDNTSWVALGEFTNQPNASGDVVIDVGIRECQGMLIVPSIAGADTNGNRYFQIAEVGAMCV